MTKQEIWLGMQPKEDVARADCGCTLYRAGSANDDPFYIQCATHAAAPEMLAILGRFVKMMDAGPLDAVQDVYHEARAILHAVEP